MEEKNYKKMYFEQRKLSIGLEMQLLNMRANILESEIPEIEEELMKYTNKDENQSQPIKG